MSGLGENGIVFAPAGSLAIGRIHDLETVTDV
jgi:hypothetical protein